MDYVIYDDDFLGERSEQPITWLERGLTAGAVRGLGQSDLDPWPRGQV